MKIGILKEATQEQRVSIIPDHVELLVRDGHTVYVTQDSGVKSGYNDNQYINSGAQIVKDNKECIEKSTLISSINIPSDSSISFIGRNKILCCNANIINKPQKVKKLTESAINLFAYENMIGESSSVLAPNSKNAAKVTFVNAVKLYNDSKKEIFGGTQYLKKTKVLIIGYGAAGKELSRLSVNHGCEVTVLDKDSNIQQSNSSRHITHEIYTKSNLVKMLGNSDMVFLAVNDPHGTPPTIIENSDLERMKEGSILIDMSSNRGGSTEKNKEEFLDQEIFSFKDVIHYSPKNVLSSTPISSSKIFSSCVIKHLLSIANKKISTLTKKGLIMKGGKLNSNIKVSESTQEEIKDPFEIIEREMNMNDAINQKLAMVFKDEMPAAEFHKE